jgi:hypothetical protein
MSNCLAGDARTSLTYAESIVSQVFDRQSVCRMLRVTVLVPSVKMTIQRLENGVLIVARFLLQ